jgi:hypothetical protein
MLPRVFRLKEELDGKAERLTKVEEGGFPLREVSESSV